MCKWTAQPFASTSKLKTYFGTECVRGHLEPCWLSFKKPALKSRDVLGPSVSSDWERLIGLVIGLDACDRSIFEQTF